MKSLLKLIKYKDPDLVAMKGCEESFHIFVKSKKNRRLEDLVFATSVGNLARHEQLCKQHNS